MSWESREVNCIKARSPPTSLADIGQITKHTTVKWSIALAGAQPLMKPAVLSGTKVYNLHLWREAFLPVTLKRLAIWSQSWQHCDYTNFWYNFLNAVGLYSFILTICLISYLLTVKLMHFSYLTGRTWGNWWNRPSWRHWISGKKSNFIYSNLYRWQWLTLTWST